MKSGLHGAIVLAAVIVFSDASLEIRSQMFNVKTSQDVTQYEKVTSASCELMCVKECVERSHCDSCTYVSDSGECFQNVQTTTTAEGELKVYRKPPVCDQSNAVDYSIFNVTWRSSGQEGDVRCNDDDYIYVEGSPTVYCSYEGLWVKYLGTCRQRIWRNPTGSEIMYRLPLPVSPGWAMCMRGTACPACMKRSFDLRQDNGDIYVHMDARFNFTTHVRKLMFNSYVGGVWGSEMTQDVFPFNNGQPFEMEFRLLTWDKMEIYVNSTLTASYTAPVSLASISYFFCSGDAFTGSELQLVDVWSGCDN